MTIESTNTRKVRELLHARRSTLLSRYKGELERADEEQASSSHQLVDVASDQWDAQVLSGMSDADSYALENVIGALHRLEAGTYGTCTRCGEPIGPKRLLVLPEAAECIDCVRFAEETPPRSVLSVG